MSKKNYPDLPILLVDDEEYFLDSMKATLRLNGITNVECCKDSREVMPLLEKKEFALILLDIMFKDGIGGDELLPLIVEKYPDIPVIMLTGLNLIGTAVDCLKKGAIDYIEKPLHDNSQSIKTVQNTLDLLSTKKENVLLKEAYFSETPKKPGYFEHIVTQDKKMQNIFKYIEAIAKSPEPVLITGEKGVMKEWIARAIHNASERNGDFVAKNVTGLDDHAFSEALFGDKKDAFTDASQEREGLVEAAQKGTLFLAEIGGLSISSQEKLLLLILENEFGLFFRDQSSTSNVRIVVSTNQDLDALVEKGKFLKDLYNRLKCNRIPLPPLRERKEDIHLLADHFIEKASIKLRKEITHVHEELFTLLSYYNFPENIRELETMINDAVSRSQEGTLSMEPFYEKIGKSPEFKRKDFDTLKKLEHGIEKEKVVLFGSDLPTYNQTKRIYLEEVLKRAKHNQSLAAKMAGLPRTTFINKLKKVEEEGGAAGEPEAPPPGPRGKT